MANVDPKSCWAKEGRLPRIAIVGAGLSGIGAVIKLREAGYTDLTIYEKADRVGGTWRDNRYPGLSCDVPSYWYSYSFEPNPHWSYRFSYGPEILAYIEHVVDRYDVRRVIRFNSEVEELRYLGPQWQLQVKNCEPEIYDFVISASGILHHPAYPEIPGIEDFEGKMFHTARWDDTVSLSGQRVGIIGTGSTSAQIVGEVTDEVAKMTVFQRTPHWMAPLPQKKYSTLWKAFLRVSPWMHPILAWFYKRLMLTTFAKATIGDVKQQQKIEQACLRFLKKTVPDPQLRARLTPDYKATCKRLIFCSDFYPAIASDKAELVTESIEAIEPTGVRTRDGRLHELDILILATGFKVSEFILPTRVFGANGIELSQQWGGAPRAHRAMALPHFPNFWMLEGPTGPVGNLSLISITEVQIGYMIQLLDKMKAEKSAALVVKPEAFDRYNRAMADAIGTTTWATGGCSSWYIDKTGKPNLYPWHPSRFYEEMKTPDYSEYLLSDSVEGAAST